MSDTVETVTVESEGLTVSLIVWRRFRCPMPGLVERVLNANPHLTSVGPFIPVGTVISLPIPIPRPTEKVEAISLWD